MSREDEGNLLVRARNDLEKKQRRVRNLMAEGKRRDLKRLQYELYHSQTARLVAAAEAIKVKKDKLEVRHTYRQLAELISDLSLSEEVYVYAQRKKSGGHRIICDYGLLDTARQKLAVLSYGSTAEFADLQAGVPRRGRDFAVMRIDQHLRLERYKWGVHADIADCYGNMDPDRIRDRHLIPEQVMEMVLTNRGKETQHKLIPGDPYTHRNWEWVKPLALRGLPQGASSSSYFVYSQLKEPIEVFSRQWGDRVALSNYCDDFQILTEKRTDWTVVLESLQVLLGEYTAGQIALRCPEGVRQIASGFDFLGFRFQRRAGKQYIRVPTVKETEFWRELDLRIERANRLHGDERDRQDRRIRVWTVGKLQDFKPAANDVDRMINGVRRRFRRNLALLEQVKFAVYCEKNGPTSERLTQNVRLPRSV
jgi:hypothetical protein